MTAASGEKLVLDFAAVETTITIESSRVQAVDHCRSEGNVRPMRWTACVEMMNVQRRI